jgi:hypothetical protein
MKTQRMNPLPDQLMGWLSLFTSSGTLVCCALPALFVALGAGAALSSLVSAVPALVSLSEYKEAVFVFAGVMLALGGWLQWRSRYAPCPIDPVLAHACTRTRRQSQWLYAMSLSIYVVGGFFAFVLPALL